ncbi:TonB-dependent siderophore receptor [Uliginosibacterium flavum]|uniref:TonB-dependent siderophore receptor n=1 Tax=Uliginosibacterium flavum TaxID=1396831 RepID=A0ABV2TFD5_9RHOO
MQPPSEKTGEYTIRTVKGATGMSLTQRETPQAVSTVTRGQLDDFRLTNVNDALDGVTGVSVERPETDRTYYTARGFDITNFQTDGIGVPFVYEIQDGDIDTAMYDRIEVIRGANGLTSGSGNPSATVNFVRKRPTRDFQASGSLSYGSWDAKRLEADVSGALIESGRLRGRMVVAADDKDSYLDRYHHSKNFFYGVVEADVGDSSSITAGYTYQKNQPKSPMWGALPLYTANGTQTNYDRSTSTAADWAYWDVENQIAFAEAKHVFDNGWQAQATVTHQETKQDSKLFYVYGTPDSDTGLGLYSYPSMYEMKKRQDQYDVRASGPFHLFGREHEAIIGISYARSALSDLSSYGQGIGTALPGLENWNGAYPEPSFDAYYNGSNFIDRHRSLFAATKLQASDKLKLILGANNTRITTEGFSYGEDSGRADSNTSPYTGIVYELTPVLSAYSSYTSIFNPQNELDENLQRLKPTRGHNVEGGLKFESTDKRLNASLALFRSRQKNLHESAGYIGATAVYKGIDTSSQGYEIEAAGQVLPSVKISAGYTAISVRTAEGEIARTYVPKHLFNLSTTWQALSALDLGARLRWRGDTHRDETATVVTKQDAYALLDLTARYAFTRQFSARINVNNVTDEKYLSSLYWSQAYYGAPRSASLTLDWKY